ncbi:hypothetical protein ZYGR_0N02760 [Zygosaccharomyces rouxii]|uniref:ZYRO0D06688p n=2 Tax=Zygosaccharomyces rouxii TaxID=4956 RepID=C5DVH1_ZYGRC|nr:uncharacterized protein ZYRO0D06688g [Zygosaccharomyces rouxii]KAH9200703.1 fungal-specific transcription factor domain-containing protein [Zygosaccharomyces rouxii]GAV48871.1 hypothetical protein ZYGR_0N02760 [Zygosaccharomyces rouxii]CAR27790.1 ZYRO0D06688p [Zygosaccharomyces rouxii]
MKRSGSSPDEPSNSRKLACQNCRKRRRKCNSEIPCSNCVKYGIECVPVDQDLRRTRYTASYVKELEDHVEHLEKTLKKAREVDDKNEKEKILDSVPIVNAVPSPGQDSPDIQLPETSATSVPPVGTNSIYPTNSLSISKKKRTPEQLKILVNMRMLSRSPFILRSLSLFFKWLYPGHFMFIHRETFLSAFFGDESAKSYYCSEELLYAIAALGSKLSSSDGELFGKSEEYYQTAKNKALKLVFQLDGNSFAELTSSNKLAFIQTLLCLAFYDVAAGENAMAWYLSGLAFRIAHEIGLHLNPNAWNDVYEDELSDLDFEVRSRIYWGCYIADHLISVLFGRSTTLRLSNSTVPETDELPDIETGIEDYIFDPKATLSLANPLKRLIVLSRITEVFAGKIFIQTQSLSQRCQYLSKFNVEMVHWRQDLPDQLAWSRESLKKLKYFNPTTTYVWFHYYIVLISYNKPFIFDRKPSRQLIEDYIEELHLILEVWKSNFENFEKCSIYMVYSVILAVQCMKTNSISQQHYKEFTDFLESPSLNYDLAKKFVENELRAECMDPLSSLTYGNDLALEYNLDFTLLNEIDTLIGTSGGDSTLG